MILSDEALIGVGINDSKKLTPKLRERLFEAITYSAKSFSFQMIDNLEIDKINILKATHLAMKMAVDKLGVLPDILLIDGNSYAYKDIEFKTIVKGDALCYSISAASIVAKVMRDNWMINVAHREFPEYGFDRHKGYCTKLHVEKLRKYGPCKYHRKTFLKNLNLNISQLF